MNPTDSTWGFRGTIDPQYANLVELRLNWRDLADSMPCFPWLVCQTWLFTGNHLRAWSIADSRIWQSRLRQVLDVGYLIKLGGGLNNVCHVRCCLKMLTFPRQNMFILFSYKTFIEHQCEIGLPDYLCLSPNSTYVLWADILKDWHINNLELEAVIPDHAQLSLHTRKTDWDFIQKVKATKHLIHIATFLVWDFLPKNQQPDPVIRLWQCPRRSMKPAWQRRPLDGPCLFSECDTQVSQTYKDGSITSSCALQPISCKDLPGVTMHVLFLIIPEGTDRHLPTGTM